MSFVNDVVTKLVEKGTEEIADKGTEAILDLAEKGKASKTEVAAMVSEILPGSESITEDAVVEAMDLLVENASTFTGLSSLAFTTMAGYFHEDEEEKAKNIHVARHATFDEANDWISSGGDAAQNEREARDKLWAEAEVFLKSLGKIGLKVLVAVGKLLLFPL